MSVTAAQRRPWLLTPAEEAALKRRVNQAFDLRETQWLREAVEAIVDWRELTEPDRLERAR